VAKIAKLLHRPRRRSVIMSPHVLQLSYPEFLCSSFLLLKVSLALTILAQISLSHLLSAAIVVSKHRNSLTYFQRSTYY